MKFPSAHTRRAAGTALVLLGVGARALTAPTLLPHWTLDPSLTGTPETMLTPALGFALDALAWLGLALVLWGGPAQSRRLSALLLALLALGSLSVLAHGWLLVPMDARADTPTGVRGDLANASIGSAWAAALASAVAITLPGPRQARTVFGVLLCLALLIGIKGVFQIAVEHPATVSMFDENPGELLGAQGLEPGTPQAREFERRLRQPDPTGWFGHANVFASFMGALSLGSGCLAWSMFSTKHTAGDIRPSSGEAGLLALVAFAAAAMLLFTGSKGAIAAWALIAGVIIAAAALHRAVGDRARAGEDRRGLSLVSGLISRRAPVMALLLCALPILAVVARGLIGESWGERSLLFRWHYLQGSAAIIREHPLLGTGPGHFKEAFLLARPPLCPEEVESPHSMLIDLVSRAGVGGAAWGALLMVLIARAGIAMLARHGAAGDDEPGQRPASNTAGARGYWLMPWAVVLVSALFGAWVERAALAPDEIAVRIVAVLACGAVCWVIARKGNRCNTAIAHGASCAALMLGVHAQIEVTSVMSGSAALCAAFIAVASATVPSEIRPENQTDKAAEPRPRRALIVIASLLAALAGAVLLAHAVLVALPWQQRLRSAASHAEVVRTAVQPRDAAVALANAGHDLARAAEVHPEMARDLYVRAAALHARAAEILRRGSDPDNAVGEIFEAVRLVELGARLRPRSAAVLAGVATLRESLNRAGLDPLGRGVSIELWHRVAELDPRGVEAPHRLALALSKLGDAEAAQWAVRAINADDNLRLDPLQQLGSSDRERLRRIARIQP